MIFRLQRWFYRHFSGDYLHVLHLYAKHYEAARLRRRGLIIITYLTLALLVCWPDYSHAHDWYEAACCSGQDCRPVPDGMVTETDHGVEVKGWGVLSETDPRIRWSQDDQDHLCIRPPGPAFYGNFAAKPKLMCVYRKRKFM